MAAFARRRVAPGILGLCGALLLSLLATPAGANAAARSLKLAIPARGDVAAMTFDVRARGRGAPGRIAVRVSVPRALRRRVGVAIVVDQERRLKRFTVYLVNRRLGRAAVAQLGGKRVVVTLRGVDRPVSVRNIARARDALATMTDEMVDTICMADIETVRTLFGLRGVGSHAIAQALKAVICDTGTDEDRQFLGELGIDVPADVDEFDCTPFTGNPFEAVCQFSDTSIDAVRIAGNGGVIFSQCFAGPNPCMVEQPGRPNNSVLFDIPDGSSSTGPLNVRSSNAAFDGWGYMRLHQSSDGGQTFERVEGFIP
jgi:hypothetical protein